MLPADYTFTPADNGAHTFANITMNTVSPQTLTATDTVHATVIGSASINVLAPDLTPPTIQITTPVDGAHYGHNAAVLADYACADTGGAGVKSCVGTVANGAAIDTATLGSHAFTVNAMDNAGNAATLTVHYTVDNQVTQRRRSSLRRGAFYKQGQSVNASYHCDDEPGGSGIASCIGDVADGAPLNTAAEGQHTLTVTATDNAGNIGTATVNYNA